MAATPGGVRPYLAQRLFAHTGDEGEGMDGSMMGVDGMGLPGTPATGARAMPSTPATGRSLATVAPPSAPPTVSVYSTVLAPSSRSSKRSEVRATGPMPWRTPHSVDRHFAHGGRVTGSQGEFDGRWVTVFGFAPGQLSAVLRQCAEYGDIVRHVPSGGNWVHVRYAERLDAQRALARNGKVVDGSIMVGVVPCIDDVARVGGDADGMGGGREPSTPGMATEMPSTPASASSVPTSIFRSASASHPAGPPGGPAPAMGWWAMLCEYIFGV